MRHPQAQLTWLEAEPLPTASLLVLCKERKKGYLQSLLWDQMVSFYGFSLLIEMTLVPLPF